MKLKSLIVLLLFALIINLTGDDMYSDFTKTKSGLLYKITQHGDGDMPQNGDTVILHYNGTFENGDSFDSSYSRNEPFSFPLGEGRVIKGWDEGVALLHVGDKATFVIPPELGYGSRRRGSIPANSTLIFDVELIDIKPVPKIEEFNVKGLKLHTTNSGLQYYIVNPGKGDTPKEGDNVSVHYSGYLKSDNSLFDSSVKRDQPFEFPLGAGKVIKGWDEGVALMKKGAKYRFIIPPELGYGSRGTGPIPGGSTLIFDVELLNFFSPPKLEEYNTKGIELHTTDSGLQYYIVEPGTGDSPAPGSYVSVHYTGYLQSDGSIFDSSVKRNQPFRFQLGAGRVIRGWDEGVALMKIGAKYRFIIPPELGYGSRATGPIPAGSTLIFDVQLLEFN